MAYITQEMKKEIVAAVKAELKKVLGKDKLKVTFSIHNHSSISATIREGTIDFGTTERQVNHYHLNNNYSGRALEVLEAIRAGLFSQHWDKSDIQSDYFNCAYYVRINIGKWDAPYQLTKGN